MFIIKTSKRIRPRILFRVKKTDIDNKYELNSRTCAYGSSMFEGVEFTASYTPVEIIKPLHMIISFLSAEKLIIFILEIYNSLQSTILTNTKERVYLSLPHIYLERFKNQSIKSIITE